MNSSAFTFLSSGLKCSSWAVVFLLLLLTAACSSSQTPEEEIEEYVQKAENYFEDKDAGDLKKLIAGDYQDTRNLTRQDIRRILAGYFMRNQKTFILSNMDELSFSNEDTTADFRLFAALSSQPLEENDLQLLDASCYLLNGTLRKNGKWLLTTAELKRIPLDEFVGSFN